MINDKSKMYCLPFKITISKILVAAFLLSILAACNEVPKKSEKLEPADTIQTKSTKAVSSNPGKPTKKAGSHTNHYTVEDKIIDTIFKLPEIKESSNYIEKQTNGKRHLKVWVAETPASSGHKYYWVKAGEDNGTNLVAHYNFYVFPDPIVIKYYDTPSDSVWTLSKWRKMNGR